MTRPTVRVVDGPGRRARSDALAMMKAQARLDCRGTFEAQADRVAHFARRIAERGASPEDLVIVLLNVDDHNGAVLAEALMPSHDWQAIRDKGAVPFARGLAGRKAIEELVASLDEEIGQKLRGIRSAAVVVMDHGVVEAFAADTLGERQG